MKAYLLVLIVAGTIYAQQVPELRNLDPVILKGSDLPELIGWSPETVVGFRATGGNWEQVPVQIDEMHEVLWSTLKNDADCFARDRPEMGLVYADANTYSGLDEDPLFDNDDELVFMARHLGEDGSASGNPTGTTSRAPVKIDVEDPNVGVIGTLYLFESDGSLTQTPAGTQPLVDYSFRLLKGEYKEAYVFNCPDEDEGLNGSESCHDLTEDMNPEDSEVITSFWRRHFSENWFVDELNIFAGDSTGQDILDTTDFQFSVTTCGRSVRTFRNGATAFSINKSGPVRAIRSWIGANSGRVTQREHYMYEQREDEKTNLRVHIIPGIMDYLNFEEGIPMTFYNCANMGGLSVDGVHADDFDNLYCPWEMVAGDAGTFFRLFRWDYDMHFNFASGQQEPEVFEHWFYDNEIPISPNGGDGGSSVHPYGIFDWEMCSTITTGQTAAWGTMGIKTHPNVIEMSNTCPFSASTPPGRNETNTCKRFPEGGPYKFEITKQQYFLEPNLDGTMGETLYAENLEPLVRRQ